MVLSGYCISFFSRNGIPHLPFPPLLVGGHHVLAWSHPLHLAVAGWFQGGRPNQDGIIRMLKRLKLTNSRLIIFFSYNKNSSSGLNLLQDVAGHRLLYPTALQIFSCDFHNLHHKWLLQPQIYAYFCREGMWRGYWQGTKGGGHHDFSLSQKFSGIFEWCLYLFWKTNFKITSVKKKKRKSATPNCIAYLTYMSL